MTADLDLDEQLEPLAPPDVGGEVVEVSAATFREALDRTRRHDYRR